jgi:hypothetical protein
MANIYKHGDIFKIDGVATDAEVITSGYGVLRHVIWNNLDTNGHTLQLVDKNNKLIWEAVCSVFTSGIIRIADLNLNWPFDGLSVKGLDSGQLLIYVENLNLNG